MTGARRVSWTSGRPQRGLTLLELIVAAGLVAVLILAGVAVLHGATRLRTDARHTEQALAVLADEAERLRCLPLQDVVPQLRAAEPAGVDRAVRNVAGAGDLPSDATLTVEVLSEQATAQQFGMSAVPDLDGEEGPSEPLAYPVVPLRLSLTWTGEDGRPRSEELLTVLYHWTRGVQ